MTVENRKGLRMVKWPALDSKGSAVGGFLTKGDSPLIGRAKDTRSVQAPQPSPKGREAMLSALAEVYDIPRNRIISLHQVHGSRVLSVEEALPPRGENKTGPYDAALTGVRGVLLTVSTADCVPLLLFDERRGVVAAIHAGWRGSVDGISAKMLAAMAERFGSRPSDVIAAIGPAIGRCCYEVGADVAGAAARGLASADGLLAPAGKGKWLLDLKLFNFNQLVEKGLPPGNIWISPYCTKCEPELFHSYRREGSGCSSQISFVGLL